MPDFAIGVDDHYGCAHLVSVTVSGSEVTVIDRRRVELVDARLPASPYHHETLRMAVPDAERLVREVQASANSCADVALQSLLEELSPATCLGLAIRIPPLPELPATVAEVHADYGVTNRADGMIYHQALTGAAARRKLEVSQFDKSRIVELAAGVRGLTTAELEGQLKALGKLLGPPWRKGHVLACAGALVALGQGPRLRS